MKKKAILSALVLCSFIFTVNAHAHFGMMIPSDSMVMPDEGRDISLTLSFSHPFESIGMEMVRPQAFALFYGEMRTDLLEQLNETKVMDHTAWTTNHRLKRPGAYTFYMEPKPYWEPAEDCYIVHYTKTVVAAFGDDEGWDAEIGAPTEIVPLSKPFGLYAGNLFQGVVKIDGQPVPYAEVEIEYYNREGEAAAPTDYMITQTVKADGNGVFSYVAPVSGWWGFAALNTAEEKIKRDGVEKDIEMGAVLWVEFQDWKTK